ncbi:MAG: iron ABC transporter permease [Campylobacterota bacterium]|nr:iron ABC transporter permease [Campylobacterota bacterium]
MSKFFVWGVLGTLFILAPFIGSVSLHVNEIFHAGTLSSEIFFELRLPRLLLAFFAGIILALSGLLFQTLFRNALMTPYTLGISSGAVLGAGVAIKLGLGSLLFGIAAISLFGFIGAMATILLLISLSRYIKHEQSTSLLLLGIALSLFYTACLMILFYMGDALQNDMLLRFSMGSLSVIGWDHPLTVASASTLLLAAIYFYRFELQLMSISDESARLKGVNTQGLTLRLLIIASFAIGILVSITGPIGFVGLIVPHIVAKLYPSSVPKRIIKTALFGGFFLVFCDMLVRLILTQSELPIGIITALIGGPFFIYLIITKGRS